MWRILAILLYPIYIDISLGLSPRSNERGLPTVTGYLPIEIIGKWVIQSLSGVKMDVLRFRVLMYDRGDLSGILVAFCDSECKIPANIHNSYIRIRCLCCPFEEWEESIGEYEWTYMTD